jgi:hypothetical protein
MHFLESFGSLSPRGSSLLLVPASSPPSVFYGESKDSRHLGDVTTTSSTYLSFSPLLYVGSRTNLCMHIAYRILEVDVGTAAILIYLLRSRRTVYKTWVHESLYSGGLINELHDRTLDIVNAAIVWTMGKY